MEDVEYEKWIHNVYLKHYKEPVSNSEWNNRIQNIPKQYKLKDKDNLWDLSGSFLEDSLFWSKLWVINPQVENPHFIYKDNFIKFDPLALSQVNKSKLSVDIQDQFPGLVLPPTFSKGALSEAQIPSSLPKLPLFLSLEDEIDFKRLTRTYRAETQPIPFYLSDNIPAVAGEILGKDDYGKLFGVSGDKAILRLAGNVPIGTYFTVFKNKGKYGNFLSRLSPSSEYEIQVKGILKVVSYIQGTSSLYKARVISAIDQMSSEDLIYKGRPIVYSFSDKKIAKGEGEIIGSPYKTRIFLTTGSIVFLNKGSVDGLYKEAVFFIRPNTENPDFFERPYNYEGAILGKLKVIHVSRNKATAVILSSRDKIYVGDSFSGTVSAYEMEKIEEGDIIDTGQDLLMDFEEAEPEAEKQPLETDRDQGLQESEKIDFEEEEQEKVLADPDIEEDEVLKEGFEEIEDNEMGEDFEMEVEQGAEEENLKDYEKDEKAEDHYKVDTLDWSEELSADKEKIKDLNEGIKESQKEVESLGEELEEKELEFEQLESENLEQEVEQGIEENEDWEFEIDDEEVLDGGDFEEEEEEEEEEEDDDELNIEENPPEEGEELGEKDLEEKELEDPKNELEELEEIDIL